MKVFLSWSGGVSHKVALALKEWLPSVIQSLKPYVSSEDIDKGARWSTDIAKELEASTYGIICITNDNLTAPWINFEAGALSKTLDKSFVTPFLFNVKRSEVQGPLVQFQSVVHDKEDIHKLMSSINGRLEKEHQLESNSLRKTFEVWWPQFHDALTSIEKDSGKHKEQKLARNQDAILEEILELARAQQKILRSPSDLLPPDYVRHVMFRPREHDPHLMEHIHREIVDLRNFAKHAGPEDSEARTKLLHGIEVLHDEFHQLERGRMRRPRVAPEGTIEGSKKE